MKPRERFLKVLNFEKPDDRSPMVEWAAWWDKTVDRWKNEGISKDMTFHQLLDHFELDKIICIQAGGMSARCPRAKSHGSSIIENEEDYDRIKEYLYNDSIIDNIIKHAKTLKEAHDKGDIIVRLWLDGYFWFPRKLFGIENHLYAFYDHADLMKRINNDLAEFNNRVVDRLFPVLKPDMVGFAEDMSYNHGPMLSYDTFKEFLMPYYKKVIPNINKRAVKVLIDSDGDITTMVPWMREAGIQGVYPLERQAGVDINYIRAKYPDFLMMGGYDKMVMSKGEKDMRQEFERILPLMKTGGYIPSVDHQTPPGVSLENYKIYVKLFREYTEKAVM